MLEALIHRIYTRWHFPTLTVGQEGRVVFLGIANIKYGPLANTAQRPPSHNGFPAGNADDMCGRGGLYLL